MSPWCLMRLLVRSRGLRLTRLKLNDTSREQIGELVTVAPGLRSSWIRDVVMRKGAFNDKRAVRRFVHRLGREHPGFKASVDLGHTLIKLMIHLADEDTAAFTEPAGMEKVRVAIDHAIASYDLRRDVGWILLEHSGPRAGELYQGTDLHRSERDERVQDAPEGTRRRSTDRGKVLAVCEGCGAGARPLSAVTALCASGRTDPTGFSISTRKPVADPERIAEDRGHVHRHVHRPRH